MLNFKRVVSFLLCLGAFGNVSYASSTDSTQMTSPNNFTPAQSAFILDANIFTTPAQCNATGQATSYPACLSGIFYSHGCCPPNYYPMLTVSIAQVQYSVANQGIQSLSYSLQGVNRSSVNNPACSSVYSGLAFYPSTTVVSPANAYGSGFTTSCSGYTQTCNSLAFEIYAEAGITGQSYSSGVYGFWQLWCTPYPNQQCSSNPC